MKEYDLYTSRCDFWLLGRAGVRRHPVCRHPFPLSSLDSTRDCQFKAEQIHEELVALRHQVSLHSRRA
jgi:hypothetical protein